MDRHIVRDLLAIGAHCLRLRKAGQKMHILCYRLPPGWQENQGKLLTRQAILCCALSGSWNFTPGTLYSEYPKSSSFKDARSAELMTGENNPLKSFSVVIRSCFLAALDARSHFLTNEFAGMILFCTASLPTSSESQASVRRSCVDILLKHQSS